MSAGTDMSAIDADNTLDNAAHGGCPATTCCALCEQGDCPCPDNEDYHCPTCQHLVGMDGYCGHCVALGDGNPYQHNK